MTQVEQKERFSLKAPPGKFRVVVFSDGNDWLVGDYSSLSYALKKAREERDLYIQASIYNDAGIVVT